MGRHAPETPEPRRTRPRATPLRTTRGATANWAPGTSLGRVPRLAANQVEQTPDQEGQLGSHWGGASSPKVAAQFRLRMDHSSA